MRDWHAVWTAVRDAFDAWAAAWAVWRDGDDNKAMPLFGHTVAWWGRAGKILQFVAGLVVILDVIGVDRLRATGVRMRRRLEIWPIVVVRATLPSPTGEVSGSDLARAQAAPSRARQWFHEDTGRVGRLATMVEGFYDGVRGTRRLLPAVGFTTVLGAGVVVLGAYRGSLELVHVGQVLMIPLAVTIAPGALFLAYAWGVFYAPAALAAPLRASRYAAVRTTAYLLDSANPGHLFRWAGLILFVLGFQFDLLAS